MEFSSRHIQSLWEEFSCELESIRSIQELEQIKSRYIGRKGIITSIIKQLPTLPEEERKVIGKLINELKGKIQVALREKNEYFIKKQRETEFDLTLPGTRYLYGKKHPLTIVMERIAEIFVGMGFELKEGPLIEWDRYNFEALNFPKLHPAREMQSTFFVTEDMLLRTHTSPVQIRVMERMEPPIRIYAPGRVYRKDPFDATHSPIFHQVEGLYIDRKVSFAELKGTLVEFTRELFGEDTKIKFLPSYFPFTEPSAEVHLLFKGAKDREPQWLEILGCGMVHPAVLKGAGIDPEEWSGYAFGLGPERITMILYGIDDIRLFFENDVRFIEQFA